MRRRSKIGGKVVKTQRRKTLKRRNTPSSVAAHEVTDVARFTHERDEALEQLGATAEILKVIRKIRRHGRLRHEHSKLRHRLEVSFR